MTQRTKFQQLLADQITNEFAASQQYNAIAVYYDNEDMPQLARHFYEQSVEERNHAMMIVQYFLDRDQAVEIPGVVAPQNAFGDYAEPIKLALAQEEQVTEQIVNLARVARDDGDYLGEQFMQWFLGRAGRRGRDDDDAAHDRRAVEGQHLRPGDLRRARDQQQDRH